MRPKLLVIFVAVLNLVTGASLGFAVGHKAPERIVLEGPMVDSRTDFVRLADPLDLPPEQAAKVRAILASVRPRFDEVLKDVHPKMEALHRELVGELSAVLDKGQMARLVDEYRRQGR